jgi:hypothetical protein
VTTATAIGRPETTLDRAIGGRSHAVGRVRGLIALPDRIVFIACTVFVLAGTLAAFRVMFWWLFLPLVILVVIATWRFMPQSTGVTKAHRNGAVLATALAFIWFVVQIPFASQYLVPIRDPGIYMVVGAVIAHTGGSPMDITGAHAIASHVSGLSAQLGPFGTTNNTDIRFQGSNGVPALIAIGFWLAGVQGGIVVDLLVGAVTLLAVYALSRRFMGPYWALLPAVILGAAMPFIYFSRTSYTEMMATLLVVASAIWIISAFNTARYSDFIVSGAMLGASGLTRIDGALEVVGAIAGLLLVVIGVGRIRTDPRMRWRALAWTAAAWVTLAIGIFDLLHNNPRYVSDLGAQAWRLWEATVAASAVLVIVSLTPFGRRTIEFTRASRIIAIAASGALAVIFVYWLSRPLWLIDHSVKGAPYLEAVASLQAQDGLAIDPTRGYSEYSLWWFAWYFGLAFLALALVGMCAWIYWSITRKNAAHIVILTTVAVVALLYINTITITPDQIWAFRRVLPAITPALAIAAVLSLRWLWKSRRRLFRVVAVLALIGCVVGTLLPWGRIMFTVDGGGQAAEIEHICSAIGNAKVVAFVAQSAPPNYSPTIHADCNVQVVTIGDTSNFSWKSLAAASSSVAVVTWNDQLVPWKTAPQAPTETAVVTMWTRHLLESPRTSSISVRSAWVGRLQPDGTVAFRR